MATELIQTSESLTTTFKNDALEVTVILQLQFLWIVLVIF